MTTTNESWRCPIPGCFATSFTQKGIKNPRGLCARHLIERYDNDREHLVSAVSARNMQLDAAQAEIKHLHDECDRLTAMVGKQKGERAHVFVVLTASGELRSVRLSLDGARNSMESPLDKK